MSPKKDISVTAPLGLSPEAATVKAKKAEQPGASTVAVPAPPEKGGPKGPEPTRYGDWERKGIAIDF